MTPEQRERDELLVQASRYLKERGVSGFGLAPLAQWLHRPLSELRAYFDSDDDIVLALVARNRVQLRQGFMRLMGDGAIEQRELRKKMWELYLESADDSALFFEAYGLAMHDSFYGPFLHGINDWLELIAEAMVKLGTPKGRAMAYATLSLAVYRGAMLDYLVTRDRARINAAMELWFDVADRIDQEIRGS